MLAIGILFSYMADSLIALQAVGGLQTAASFISTVLFVLFSAMMLGVGAGLFVHWILSFGRHVMAFVMEFILSFATFFIGLGAALTIGGWWTGAQLFVTFLFASGTMFVLSFVSLFGGVFAGMEKIVKYVKKRRRR